MQLARRLQCEIDCCSVIKIVLCPIFAREPRVQYLFNRTGDKAGMDDKTETISEEEVDRIAKDVMTNNKLVFDRLAEI